MWNMKIKILIYSILCSCALVNNGCNMQKTSLDSGGEPQEIVVATVSEKRDKRWRVTNEDMRALFTKYLTIDEESILILNQKPREIYQQYWEAYGAYKLKTNEILGEYLSVEAKEKLGKQYIHDDFHYPRLLEINDYLVIGFSKVEDVSIISKYIKNNNDIYEVMVTAIAQVVNRDYANEKYQWNDNKGYYETSIDGSLDVIKKEDKIRVTLKYLVETVPGEDFEIKTIKENTGIYLGTDEQTNIQNNSFVTRIPYADQVIEKDKEKIHRFLDSFMKQDYNFYNYYRKAYHTNYEMFEIALIADLRLRNIVKLKEDYQLQFSPMIIPVKDDIAFLEFDAYENIIIETYLFSSENNPAYEVSVEAEATLVDGSSKTYEYTYLFTFENDMILSVRFINQKDISADETV